MLETHTLTSGLKLARTEPANPAPTPAGTAANLKQPAANVLDGQTSESARQSSSTPKVETRTVNHDESFGVIFETTAPTYALPPINTPSSSANNEGGIAGLDRPTSIVVIVVVTVVAGVLLWTGAFLLFRQYKKGVNRKRSPAPEADEASLEQERLEAKFRSGLPSTIVSPGAISELEAGPPEIGSTPNPAELAGDDIPPAKPWAHRRSFFKSPTINHPQYSPRSVQSNKSARRTVRESFGEKVNDPATALGRLRIPNPLATMARASPNSASPRGGSFWRLPRSPRSPAATSRLSAQLPKPSPRSGLSGNTSRPTTPGRVKDGTQRDATP